MKNNLEIFRNEEFGEIRTITENGKILFCGSDIAKALGYTNSNKAINDHCKEDGVTIRSVIDNLGRIQQAKFINEGNLYRLISSSKLESAQNFETWVFDEVLPAIRRTGGYIVGEETMNEDQLILSAMKILNKKVENLRLENTQQKKVINELKPKAKFAETIVSNGKSIDVGSMAKLLSQNGINIGRNRLFTILRKNGYLMTSGNSTIPTQKSMNLQIMEIDTREFTLDGEKQTYFTPMITTKGQVYFMGKFLKGELM